MPKKQRYSWEHSKPATSYVHPSLATSKSASTEPAPTGVNARLEQLRRSQGHRIVPQDLSASRYAPRPKSTRRTPGPPPPRSWLVKDEEQAHSHRNNGARMRPIFPGALPGVDMPFDDSMMHHVLHSIAKDLDYHVEYDRQYLSILPLEAKTQLLSYVACFGPHDGASLQALRYLLSYDESQEPTGILAADELKRLDLGGSIGRRIQLNELEKCWTKKTKSTAKMKSFDVVADSWEDEIDLASLSLSSSAWLPSLTHLSLAYPGPDVSWTDLLSFSRHLSAITHLSLSGWPRPALPKSAAATSFGDTVDTNDDSKDEDDARTVLRVFSKNTPSLEWLSLARCHSWFDDLSPRQAELSPSGQTSSARQRRNRAAGQFSGGFEQREGPAPELGAEWCGSWRHVQHVNVSQEWVPTGLGSPDLKALLQARNAVVQSPRWELELRGPGTAALGEAYRILAPTTEMQQAMEQQQARKTWANDEVRALSLAAKVRTLRAARGVGRCEFEYGWRHKAELQALGYDEHILFEAGM